ncbi:hypothetical protein BS47DRAFT_1366394 [Hydnum rufescens UP504]|uniref:Uncharacterized protein n=1 Tax=Hydnum rufescens UP504 TaxID=1448309 RepID=A0A9P6ALZ3_9AGAM|nr:hypothetical protein BS47DRAFT_1366394 [Hydnum rufescens UP504]
MKYTEYDVRLEEALDVQPLPRVDTDPHGLGLFAPSSDFEEPSGDASFDPSHGPKAGPGSIINLPAWPTPPSDQTRLGNSSIPLAASFHAGGRVEERPLDPLKSQAPIGEPMESWEMGPVVGRPMGRHPSGDPPTL